MRRSEIIEFLQNSQAVAVLAGRVRSAIFAESRGRSVSHHVSYKNLPDHPNDFAADVLHIRFIARLEYIKLIVNTREFLAAQYAFFALSRDTETRLPEVVRLVQPGAVILPNREVQLSDDEEMDAADLVTIKDEVSTILITHALTRLDEWKPEQT
ncbi:hypothetical protein [Massilia sp. DD77]|uniref:hypothetical protein n=1 Tax=Massilia sp. DD77 TaxID=3109349 RepID=UPI002FFE3C08